MHDIIILKKSFMFAKSDIIRYTKLNKEADAIVLVWIFNVGQEIYISSKYWQGDL